MEMLIFYIAVLAVFPVLRIAARREPPLQRKGPAKLRCGFDREASFLYGQHLRMQRKRGNVTRGGSGSRSDREHEIGKLSSLLMFIAAGALLASLLAAGSYLNGPRPAETQYSRPDYGEDPDSVTLDASYGDVDLGEYSFTISPRQYTEKELSMKAEEVFSELRQKLCGDNASLEEVTGDLYMPREAEGYPFSISWESSDYSHVDSDGSVFTDDLEDGASVKVKVTAVLSAEGFSFRKNYALVLKHAPESTLERMSHEIRSALSDEDEDSGDGIYFRLPLTVAGTPVTWTVPEESPDAAVFFLMTAAGLFVFFEADRERERKQKRRAQIIHLEYPGMCSRLVLYVGAGLSVRAAFRKIGTDYENQRKKGGRAGPLYEEIRVMLRELDSGIPEAEAYTRFGSRCGDITVSRFVSLLTQNLRKGNIMLLESLQDEAQAAFRERRNIARQLGEEAGTKLLLPMIIMLVVTMVILIFPAYAGFSL